MEFLTGLIDFVLHLDAHLAWIAANYGAWIYAILFLIVFCETGLVVTPFLPGDSLLFAAGTVAAAGGMNAHLLVLLLAIAAVLGDAVNYAIGRYLGPRVFRDENARFLNRRHLQRTHDFYERYGGKTLVIARFVPIVRTYAPFVAGMGSMPYLRFAIWNVSGGILWVVLLVYFGYFFGNVPVVKQNIGLVIVLIILVSIAPGVVEFLRHHRGGVRREE